MKKLLTLFACVAFTGALSAQSTSTDAPKAEATEKVQSCTKGEAAKAGCCVGKAKASVEAGAGATASTEAPATPSCHAAKAEAGTAAVAPDAKAAGCCAGKAKAEGASCQGGKAHADNTEAAPTSKE